MNVALQQSIGDYEREKDALLAGGDPDDAKALRQVSEMESKIAMSRSKILKIEKLQALIEESIVGIIRSVSNSFISATDERCQRILKETEDALKPLFTDDRRRVAAAKLVAPERDVYRDAIGARNHGTFISINISHIGPIESAKRLIELVAKHAQDA